MFLNREGGQLRGHGIDQFQQRLFGHHFNKRIHVAFHLYMGFLVGKEMNVQGEHKFGKAKRFEGDARFGNTLLDLNGKRHQAFNAEGTLFCRTLEIFDLLFRQQVLEVMEVAHELIQGISG